MAGSSGRRELDEYHAYVLRIRAAAGDGRRGARLESVRVEYVNDRSVEHFAVLSDAFRHIEQSLARELNTLLP